ncbi:GIY-YIG nuclease family protein [Burkholderia sp. JKS000303]|uniref:GIY-YIG nuclease family protein n=1 Tax=Burkholderia sp. JKS000303 TaxID=1938747 RepID=UPI00117FE7EA|nr:GIY-YIG nuclease family protein [Burkholderia sp. JKS000303]
MSERSRSDWSSYLWPTRVNFPSVSDVDAAITEFNRDFPRPKMGAIVLSLPYHIVDDFAFGSFPNSAAAGVYLVFDREDRLLYIGKADGLGKRLGAHFGWNPDRTAGFVKNPKLENAHAVRTIGLPAESWFEAAAIEALLIRKLDPDLNVVGRETS